MNNQRKVLTVSIIAVAILFGVSFGKEKHSYIPPDGFVPNEETALKIAEAVLIPIYGKKMIDEGKPFVIKLEKETWVIRGVMKMVMLGGVAEIEIAKKDGRILRVSHGK